MIRAVRTAALTHGWRVCRACGELGLPPDEFQCVACPIPFALPGGRRRVDDRP